MRFGYCLVLLLLALCRNASAQGYFFLYQYFEADSTARPGYSSIEEKTTQFRTSKNRDFTETTVVESFYDESGRLTMEEKQSNTGIETYLTFEYDSTTGRMNHIVQTGGNVKHEAFAQYDAQGRLSEIIHCSEDKPCSVRRYVFDEDNTERLYIPRQTIEIQFDKDKPRTLFGLSASDTEKEELARERFFDPEGNLEEIKQYTGGTFSIGWIYEYDRTGRKTKVWVYNSAEKTLAAECEYDEYSGLLSAEYSYVWVTGTKIIPYGDKGPETTYMTYDAQNRLIKTESNRKNSGKTREYTYNAY